MSKLSARTITGDEYAAYDELISNHGRIFAQRKWLDLLDGETSLLGLFDGGDNLIGACPIQVTKRLGLNLILRPQFTPYSGPYFSGAVVGSTKEMDTRRFFLEAICTHIENVRPAVCCLPFDTSLDDCLPFRWRKYKVVPAWTYLIPLAQSVEEIESKFSSTRRRNIRAATRDSIEIRALESFELVEQLAQNTYDRQNKHLAAKTLGRILYDFASPQNSFAFCAFQERMPISTVFCVFDKDTAYYIVGGYDASHAHHGTGAACMHAAILHAKSIGLQTFDFEGSSIPAIEKYFRGFGGVLAPYFTVNRAWLPIELLLKFRKRELF